MISLLGEYKQYEGKIIYFYSQKTNHEYALFLQYFKCLENLEISERIDKIGNEYRIENSESFEYNLLEEKLSIIHNNSDFSLEIIYLYKPQNSKS